jgi:hypothetical protein
VKTSGNRLRRLIEYRLVLGSTETGELGRHFKAKEEEMTGLHSDLVIIPVFEIGYQDTTSGD